MTRTPRDRLRLFVAGCGVEREGVMGEEVDAREMYLSSLEQITDDERVLAAIAALRGELLDENTRRSAAHVIRKAAGRKHRHPRTAKALRLVAAALEEAALVEKWDRDHGMHLSRGERSARRRELGAGAPRIPYTPPQLRDAGGRVEP